MDGAVKSLKEYAEEKEMTDLVGYLTLHSEKPVEENNANALQEQNPEQTEEQTES